MKMVEGFPKRVANTFEKGEIARNEQFLLFPKCFQKTCTEDKQTAGLVWERFKNLDAMYSINETEGGKKKECS